METVSDEPLFKDNEVRLLVDGPETYAAMLAAIGAAKENVHLETYIFNEDVVGDRFADALLAKSAAGVEVRVIYDSLGSRESSPEFFDRMRKGGIQLVEFHPVNPATGGNPLNANVRDHRKLLVVDGETAFTGGVNLDKNYASSSVSRRRPTKAPAGVIRIYRFAAPPSPDSSACSSPTGKKGMVPRPTMRAGSFQNPSRAARTWCGCCRPSAVREMFRRFASPTATPWKPPPSASGSPSRTSVPIRIFSRP